MYVNKMIHDLQWDTKYSAPFPRDYKVTAYQNLGAFSF